MIPNGAAYENFPPFANSGTRSAPAEAKYAQGMVPSDTFPAEWANYFFHGATAGITRLNADTGSIKKEINNVLDNFNITPDGSLTNQLMSALNKLKQEAALAAHPVGSLYWTSSSENPAVTFGGGTWVQIKDRFILAAGDTYANGATGGSATVTLTVAQMPSHNHGGSTGNGGVDHTHNMDHEHYTGGNTGGMSDNSSGTITRGSSYIGIAGGASGCCRVSDGDKKRCTDNGSSNLYGTVSINVSHTHAWGDWSTPPYVRNDRHDAYKLKTDGASAYLHSHRINSNGGGESHNNMPPYICKFCWERVS